MAERIMSSMFASASDDQLITEAFGRAVLESCIPLDVDFEEFKGYCTDIGGKLGDYYMSGLRVVAPDLYAAIHYDNSIRAFAALCRILNMIIKGGTDHDWRMEAQTFLYEWGSVPTRDDVIAVCQDLAADPVAHETMIDTCGTVCIYADTLWHWILRVSGVNCM